MQSNNKLYSFFIIIALLFWNPISFFLLYSNTPIYSEKIFRLFYWLVFIGGIILILLIQRNIFNERIKNIILTLAFTGILFSGFVIIDRAYGLISTNESIEDQNQEWLIFEPNSKATAHTVEFEYEVIINSLGLRDHEIEIEKGNKYRILCFGDSWTYGYGVNVEHSWPKILENYLVSIGYNNVEVINCGRPGQFTGTYKKYMEKAVPLLKPDLVLVGVLQIDDLAQLFTYSFVARESSPFKTIMRKIKTGSLRFMQYSFKNILGSSKTLDITSDWKKISTSMVSDFNRWQDIRFSALDDSVQSLFKSGNLAPSLLDYYINYPDRITIFNNQNHPATIYAAQEMTNDFKEMNIICDEQNSDLIFVNIPMNYFTGHEVIRTPSDVLNTYFKNNNNIDSIYQSVANANNLPYIELTDHFIGLQDKSDYLFKYDGHPNEKGYAEIGNYIGKQLIENKYIFIYD
jgi:lysophospholipase L1-like esterase